MLSPRFSTHTVSDCGRPGFSRLPLLTSAVLIGACLACSGEATDRSGARATEGAITEGAREDTLTVMHYSANVDTWQDFGMSALTLLFQPLMHVHDGEIVGRLAKRREMSPDGRSWTYHLRTDARWHDGAPFTAHDVEFTIDLFQDPDFDNPAGVQAARGASVEVIDDSTLTLTFGQYRSDYNWVGREVFLPKHLLEGLDPAETGEWEFWESPVGNGPYRFVRMVPNQLIELEANPDYFRGKPAVDRVFIRVMGNASTELQSGQVDVWSGIGPVTQGVVAQDPRFQIYRPTVGRATSGIHWNHRHPILGDPLVRRALALAIDRSELAAAVGIPDEGPFVDVLLSRDRVLRGDMEGVPEPLGPDPESARELLQDAGWKDADGDGVLERGGRPLRFTMLGGWRANVVLREQFRRIGVEVELVTMGQEVIRERLSRGDFEAMIFPVALSRYGQGLLSGTTDSIIGYASEEMQRLEARLDTTFLVEERERIYAESWPIFQRDIPITLLLPSLRGTIANGRLRGVSERDGVDLVLHLDEVWMAGR
jgi:peptide/nickel transport system substrate-binding protein